MNETVCC